jgi:hypothetical protein
MLQHVAAAHKIGTARIFDLEIAADYFDTAALRRGSARRLAWIIAFAAITCAA